MDVHVHTDKEEVEMEMAVNVPGSRFTQRSML